MVSRRLHISSTALWVGLGGVIALATLPNLTVGMAIALMAIGLAGISAIRLGVNEQLGIGLLNPSTVVFGPILVLYVARPLFVLATGEVGTPSVGYWDVDRLGSGVVERRTLLLACAVVTFTVAFQAVPLRAWRDRLRERRLRQNALAVLIVTSVVSATAGLLILQNYRDFGSTFSALTVRHAALAGANYLVAVLTGFKLFAIVYSAVALDRRLTAGSTRIPPRIYLLWLLSLALDSVSGERAELIVTNLLPFSGLLMVFKLRTGFRFAVAKRAVASILIVSVGISIFVGYRVYVRDVATRGQAELGDVIDAFTNLPEIIFGTSETAAFDFFIITPELVPSIEPHRGSETFVASSLALVPRALFDGKPERSAVHLTHLMAPLAYDQGANSAFSTPVDLYYTAGYPAVVVGMAGLGWIFGWLVRGPLRSRTMVGVGLSFLMAGLLLPALRSDLFALGGLPASLAILWLAWATLTRPARTALA